MKSNKSNYVPTYKYKPTTKIQACKATFLFKIQNYNTC